MRKYLCMMISVVMMLGTVSGCDPVVYRFDAEQLKQETVRLELIYYENEEPKHTEVTEDMVLVFKQEKARLVQVLEQDKINAFIDEFSMVRFHHRDICAEEPVGYGLRIILQNNHFFIIACKLTERSAYGMVAEFDKDCNFVKHIATFAEANRFNALLEKYFSAMR